MTSHPYLFLNTRIDAYTRYRYSTLARFSLDAPDDCQLLVHVLDINRCCIAHDQQV